MSRKDAEIYLTIKPNQPIQLAIKGCSNFEAHKAILGVIAGQMWDVSKTGLKVWKKERGKEITTPPNEIYARFRSLVGDVTESFFQEMAIRPIKEILSVVDYEDKKRISKICNRVFSGRVIVEINEENKETVEIKVVDSESNTKYFHFLLDSVKAIMQEWAEISINSSSKEIKDKPTQETTSEDLSKADELIKKVIEVSDFSNL